MVEWKQLSEIHIQIHPAPLHLTWEMRAKVRTMVFKLTDMERGLEAI